MDRAAPHRSLVDQDLSLPGLQSGNPTHDTASGGVAESRGRHAPPLAHTVLELAVAQIVARIPLAVRVGWPLLAFPRVKEFRGLIFEFDPGISALDTQAARAYPLRVAANSFRTAAVIAAVPPYALTAVMVVAWVVR